MKLPTGWRVAVDRFCADAKPFEDSCFRSVELAWAYPDDVISGEGSKAQSSQIPLDIERVIYILGPDIEHIGRGGRRRKQ